VRDKTFFRDPVFLALLLVLSVFLFAGLGDDYLWQDEAESAILARNILEFGYPRAFDGVNTTTTWIETGLGPNYAWNFHPWLHFYPAALSFALLGESTFSARFPFALFGLGVFLLTYYLALELFKNINTARISAFLTAFSVPFILLMRQCRYYSMTVFFSLLAVVFYLRFLKEKKGALIALFLSLLLLFYTNHGAFIPVFAGLALYHALFCFKPGQLPRLSVFALVLAALTIPWFVYSNSGYHAVALELNTIRQNLEFQVRVLNKYIIPLGFFAVVYLARAIKTKRFLFSLSPDDKKPIKLFLVIIATTILFFCFVHHRLLRYLVFIFPLLFILQAYVLERWLRAKRILTYVILALLVTTNLFQSSLGYAFSGKFKEKFRSYLSSYIYEITHDYSGPAEGIVGFLQENASSGETVKYAYGDSPMFYIKDLKFENGHFFENETFPDWVIFSRHWCGGEEGFNGKYMRKIAGRYKKYVIDAPDIPWQNRPDDLEYHRFRTDTETPRIIIFEKR